MEITVFTAYQSLKHDQTIKIRMMNSPKTTTNYFSYEEGKSF